MQSNIQFQKTSEFIISEEHNRASKPTLFEVLIVQESRAEFFYDQFKF